MYAIIDIGSNTIRLVIYKAENNSYTVLLNKKEMAALASYVHDNMMSGAGIDKACHALTTFKKIVNEKKKSDEKCGINSKEFYKGVIDKL